MHKGWCGLSVNGEGAGCEPSCPRLNPVHVPQLLDSDQELYKNFPLVISERWQQEVAETVYEAVNSDTDKIEARKRAKNKQLGHEEGEGRLHVHGYECLQLLTPVCVCVCASADYALGKDCIMHGYMLKLGNPFLTQWQRRYFYLFPNRVEWRGEGESRVSRAAGAGRGQAESHDHTGRAERVSVCVSASPKEGWLRHFQKHRDTVSLQLLSAQSCCCLHR